MVPENNLAAHEIIGDLEVALRAFIQMRLQAEYGVRNWWRQGVPEDVRRSCENRGGQDVDRRLPLTPPQPLLTYCDFGDLEKIILVTNNWNKRFTVNF